MFDPCRHGGHLADAARSLVAAVEVDALALRRRAAAAAAVLSDADARGAAAGRAAAAAAAAALDAAVGELVVPHPPATVVAGPPAARPEAEAAWMATVRATLQWQQRGRVRSALCRAVSVASAASVGVALGWDADAAGGEGGGVCATLVVVRARGVAANAVRGRPRGRRRGRFGSGVVVGDWRRCRRPVPRLRDRRYVCRRAAVTVQWGLWGDGH